MTTAVIACGALALHVNAIAERRGWEIDVHPLPPELHNRPERIAPAVEALAERLAGRYDRILIKELGLGEDEITQVLLAGSFGSYLSPASAVRIGLVPKLALPRIISAGNVAGEGAKMAALSLRERAAADAILDEVEYVELSGRADFNDMFMDELAFPG